MAACVLSGDFRRNPPLPERSLATGPSYTTILPESPDGARDLWRMEAFATRRPFAGGFVFQRQMSRNNEN